MTEHIVSSYDDDLKEISDGVINMGDEVLGALNNIETLLKSNDHELAQKIIKNDLIINDLGQSVENKVFNILASRQPMAIDLRIVFSAVKISLPAILCAADKIPTAIFVLNSSLYPTDIVSGSITLDIHPSNHRLSIADADEQTKLISILSYEVIYG